MKSYNCTVLYDASTGDAFEAESPEAAADMAKEQMGSSPSLCHQCSSHVEIGDSMGVIVYDNETNEVALDTTYHAQEIERLKARIAELEAAASPPAPAGEGAEITPENPIECTTCGALVVGVAPPPAPQSTVSDYQIDELDKFYALHVMAPRGKQSVREFARAVLALASSAQAGEQSDQPLEGK